MGDEEGSKPNIGQAIEAISSLISLSHSIKVFTVKWQPIRNKLEELTSGLIAVENCVSSFSLSLSSLVLAILVTVNECYDLATRCFDVSFSGKLLMQSDLDVIAGKFDRHAKNLSGIYSAGILSHGFALVVSKPNVNACKDDMRFYIRDLMTRMKIGDIEMKRQALLKLNEAVEEDSKYVKIIIDIGDMVNVLVNFLDSARCIQEEAAKVVYLISGFDMYKPILIQSGIIGPLVRVLEGGSDLGREASARCLKKLTENSDNAWSVSAHGGFTALLKICSCGEFRGELIGTACGVLRNLVSVEEIKRFMIEEGAISAFIKLVRSKEEIIQVNSIDFLQTISWNDEPTRQIVIKEGGIRELVRVSDPNSPSSSKTKEITLRAIENLCFSSASRVNTLISYGFVDHLLYLLRNGEISVQESALKVTFRLCGVSEEAKRVMGEAGFMPELVRFLDAKSLDVREMASEALYCLILVPKNRKKFAQDDRNIGHILQSLDPEEGSSNNHHKNLGNKKVLISILTSLTSCNSARRKIAASGYLKNIEKLAEAEVCDAKKLVKKLSTNRFRSMLSGIWHS